MSKRLLWISVAVLALAVGFGAVWLRRSTPASAEFIQLMNRGNGLLEKGDAAGAIELYTQALQRSPASIDVRLNLANAYLRADRPADAAAMARQVIELERNSAAAHYLLGCALLRQNQPEPASEAFQQSWKIEPGIPSLDFLTGMAQQQLGHYPDAIRLFENVIKAVPDHPSAHYQLSQLYRRAGRTDDATKALQEHQRLLSRSPNTTVSTSDLERSKHTQPLSPFILSQPDPRGIAVRFADATQSALGAAAAASRGPLAVVDTDRDGRLSLFVQDKGGGFVLLENKGGTFAPLGRPLRAPAGAAYASALTGDLDNDGFDDVVVLGPQDTRVFKFYAQGRVRDATRTAGLEGVKASSGLLADLDFTGNLDLVVVQPEGAGLGLYRNLGNFYFDPNWTDSGLPQALPQAAQLLTEDWNNEGLPGLFIARSGSAPAFFAKQRAAAFIASELTQGWPAGAALVTADFDNDLRPEAALATADAVEVVHREPGRRVRLSLQDFPVSALQLIDYDNDGWLDLLAWGARGVRVWRNAGVQGFTDQTQALGLDQVGKIDGLASGDFDADGDTDLVTSSDAGLRLWRNEGGNQNLQLKVRLAGNRSNTSSLGVRVQLLANDWRTSRTVRRLPLEIGVGQHRQLDALKVHWFDLSTAQVDVPVGPGVLTVNEPTLPSGSCPYLYVWDGTGFRFVSDVLGAAPLGLPQNETRFVAADPEEYLVLGDATQFPPRDGFYEVRLTDELREILYLDEAHLVAVDHPVGTVVYPTSKMMPGPPFPKHELWTLTPLAAPHRASRSDGLDVTPALARIDQQMVSPVRLRRPQLRGMAEPFAVTLDFGALPVERPLVLALTGWIHFGGSMANISGSIDPTLPFPFPILEVELPDGTWQKVDVGVGTPAGKTKTILVDLEKKLPAGAQRLRLSTAYEIYWDAAQLCEKADPLRMHEHPLAADRTDLRGRGYSRYADLPASIPRTPVYTDVSPTPPWDRTPSGWFTRYGPVDDLVKHRDDRLALLAGGDELALSFDANRLPPPAPGMVRHFFLHLVGWDKDSDFHVEQGWRLEPFPYNGMDDQTYGKAPRPPHLESDWIRKYNTRWIGPEVLSPAGKVHPTQEWNR